MPARAGVNGGIMVFFCNNTAAGPQPRACPTQEGTIEGSFTAADIRFTRKGTDLYAIALAWPAGDTLHIKTLASGSAQLPGEIASVAVLGSKTDVRWRRDLEGLHLELPDGRPTPVPPAVAFKIALR